MGKRSKRRKAARRAENLRQHTEAESLPQNRRGEYAITPVAQIRVVHWPPLRRTY